MAAKGAIHRGSAYFPAVFGSKTHGNGFGVSGKVFCKSKVLDVGRDV
jgi:hypothetical protein